MQLYARHSLTADRGCMATGDRYVYQSAVVGFVSLAWILRWGTGCYTQTGHKTGIMNPPMVHTISTKGAPTRAKSVKR